MDLSHIGYEIEVGVTL